WYREDIDRGEHAPAADAATVARELLDPSGADVAVLNADDAVTLSLMPSPYRAAALARAHNDWIRERWLDADARLRGAIVCPALRVPLSEGGLAWLPGILWRLDTNWRGLRSEVPWVERKPSEVVREHVRFSTQPLEHTDGRDALLFEMLESVGAPEILCFASDYPHWDFDDPAFMLRRLPEAWRERVLHANAATLYGLAA